MFSIIRSLAFVAIPLIIFAQPAHSQTPAPILGQTSTEWKGVNLQVVGLSWVNEKHLMAVVRVAAGEGAENPTEISIPSPFGSKPPSYVYKDDNERAKYETRPYSLAPSVLIDEETKLTYKALPDPPKTPFKGPTAIAMTLSPGQSVQMAVQFPAPPPVPDELTGEAKRLRVTLLFPKAKQPIKGLIVPQRGK